jgi:hypothetical protein
MNFPQDNYPKINGLWKIQNQKKCQNSRVNVQKMYKKFLKNDPQSTPLGREGLMYNLPAQMKNCSPRTNPAQNRSDLAGRIAAPRASISALRSNALPLASSSTAGRKPRRLQK